MVKWWYQKVIFQFPLLGLSVGTIKERLSLTTLSIPSFGLVSIRVTTREKIKVNFQFPLLGLFYAPHVIWQLAKTFQFPLLGLRDAREGSNPNDDKLSIPSFGLGTKLSHLREHSTSTFNSLFWACNYAENVAVGIETYFQFPLLGLLTSGSFENVPIFNLSIPSFGLVWLLKAVLFV